MFEQYEYNFFENVSSTQEYAKKLIEDRRQGLANFIIHAKMQNNGLGRCNRSWHSQNGDLTFSFAHKFSSIGMDISKVTYLVAVTVRKILLNYIKNEDIFCKWPNDVMIKDCKLAGILVEMVGNYLIIGIGINFKKNNHIRSDIKLISLEDLLMQTIDQKEMIKSIIDSYEELYDDYENNGFYNIRSLWLKNAYQLNKEVTVYNFDGTKIKGIFRGIDQMGLLLIENNSEKKEIIDCQKMEFTNY